MDTDEPAVELAWGARTDPSRHRQVNEDSMLALPPVFLVADGMGGHHAGDVASTIVVEEFAALGGHVPAAMSAVRSCLDRSSARINGLGLVAGRAAGTTVAAAVVVETAGALYWLIFGVGDSRVYRFSGGRLVQVSHDHSVVQELVDAGVLTAELAVSHPERHVVTRAVGGPDRTVPDCWLVPIAERDRILVCSDGLTAVVPDAVLERALAGDDPPQLVADAVVLGAVEEGATDNVTAIVVDVVAVAGGPDVARTQPRGALAESMRQTVPRRPRAEVRT